MGRRIALTVLAGVAIAAAQALITNYATTQAPQWLKDPWRVWPVLIILVLLAVIIQLITESQKRDPSPTLLPKFATTAPAALRRPALEVRPHGRTAEISRLAKLLKAPADRFAVVSGAGGMGKTTLAAWLAEQAEQRGKSVFWIRWRDPESLTAQMVEVATTLGLPMGAVAQAQETGASLIDLVWNHLTKAPNWVIVIDNVDRPRDLGPASEPIAEYRGWVRPSKRGLLVVTTRDRSPATWGPAAEMVELTPLDDSAGAQVLLDLAKHAGSTDDAKRLSTRLGGLPLALHAAGTLLAQPTARTKTFAGYLADRSADVLPERPDATKPDQARALIGYTWELSLDQLSEEGHPLARPLLRSMALLAEAPIPRELIAPGLIPPSECAEQITSAMVDASLAGLYQYGLIDAPARSRTSSVDTLVLHPLVRETSRLLVDRTGNQAAWSNHVEDHVIAFVRELLSQPQGMLGIARMLAPHLIALSGLTSQDDARFRPARGILGALAHQCNQIGDHATDLILWQRIHDTDRAILGDDHRETLGSQNNLAEALRGLGRYREAVELHQRTLDARRRMLGEDHAETLGSQNNLAIALRALGRYEEAVELHQRTLDARRRMLGGDHAETLGSQDNLALALGGLGRCQEALELHQRTLNAWRQTLAVDHPDILISQNNFALALRDVGRYREAVEWQQRTLDASKRVLGEDHPDTLRRQSNLAGALGRVGRHWEAVELEQRTLDGLRRVLGEDHPDTLKSRDNLANALERVRGKWWRWVSGGGGGRRG